MYFICSIMVHYRIKKSCYAIQRCCLLYNKGMKSPGHATVKEIFRYALQAVDPYNSVALQAQRLVEQLECRKPRKVVVIGFGKASCTMAKAMENHLEGLIGSALVITKYGHCLLSKPQNIRVYEAAHPVPDENGLKGTREIIRILEDEDENTLVICLISGGGSALLVQPYNGITLAEKQEITGLLLKAGADINEVNTVRKHISKVKGGRLAGIAYPAKTVSLILSDVIGDRLDVIASGPTAPDITTYSNAMQVLKKYGLTGLTPPNIFEVLKKGAEGLLPETPKTGDKIFENVENIIIGSNTTALNAAKKKAEELAFHTEILSPELAGEARDAGKWLALKAKEFRTSRGQRSEKPLCLISGGETTVTVKGNGMGGRNMELALSFAMEIGGIDGIALLSAGTDGTDGPTDAAGAVVDGQTIIKARHIGLAPEAYLNNNDSYNFFKKIDGLFVTGPTGTNVMDMQVVVIE